MRQIYNVLLIVLLPLVLLRLFWKSLKVSDYRKRIAERFGFIKKQNKETIWLHAVSFGELKAAIPLINELQKNFPNYQIVVTTMTVTGSQLAQKSLNQTIFHCYCPYDYPFAINNFLKRIKPKISILMETEIWPNWLFYCNKNNIAILLANARLSKKSLDGYKRFSFFLIPLLQAIKLVAAQSEQDVKNFLALGIPKEKIELFGNIKFDLTLPSDLQLKANEWRSHSNSLNKKIFFAASTHEGEEKIILEAFSKLKQHIPNLLLIIAPRHPERFEAVIKLCAQYSKHITRRSIDSFAADTTDIFVVDTMGELLLFYAIANVAFIGGSLVNVGGHNLLEAAVNGIPTITGKHMHNFQFIYDQMSQLQTNFTVENREGLIKTAAELLQNEILQANIYKKNISFIEQNRGVLQKHLKAIKNFL